MTSMARTSATTSRRGPGDLELTGPVHFTCAARTDVGIVRSGNEDNYLMLADRGVFIVADGMGGHAAGEVASEMAVRITSHEIGSLRGLSDAEASDRMRAAIRTANDAIFERTLSERDKRGMGTTATVLVLHAPPVPDRPGGRQPGVPASERRAPPADQGPLPCAGAGRRGAAHPRPGASPPLQQRDHPLRRGER